MKKRNPHLLRNWFFFIIFLLVIFFGVKGYWHHLLSPVSSDTTLQSFTVQSGEGTSAIADRLKSQNLIRSSFAFKAALKIEGDAGKLEAGDFQVSPSMSTNKIIKILSKGGSEDKSVTVVEGLRDEEVAQKLQEKLGVKGEDFLSVAKIGYMFPDTYSFSPKVTAEDIATEMEDNFNKKYTQEIQSKIASLGLTPAQGVILASIVEREARSDGVRTMVASILLKRLKIGMALDVDSTIQYALGYQQDEKTWWKNSITEEDKQISSPYNTYTRVGLPPTPICNPSVSSLIAVSNANPSVPYLYYYHDSKGNSYYAKTLEEHNANVSNHP